MLYCLLSSGTATVVSFKNLYFDTCFDYMEADPIERGSYQDVKTQLEQEIACCSCNTYAYIHSQETPLQFLVALVFADVCPYPIEMIFIFA